ncbi:MAG: gamma-glutamylcyclotransferase [Nitrospirales bacterium]|nr:gamma-glutamylcyclotransferase [Nitrospirales bacterium]
MEKKQIFVYGTLMWEEVWSRIVRGTYQKVPAQLRGYQRLKIKEQAYPGLVKGDGAVWGCVWLDVDTDDVARLDAFEEKYYLRVEEEVHDGKGQAIQAEVYVIQEAYTAVLDDQEWDPEQFEAHGLKMFTQNYWGFHQEHQR